MASRNLSEETLLQIDQVASNVILTTGISPDELRLADDQQLLHLQGQLLMGSVWGRWEVASNLISRSRVTERLRSFRIESALPEGMDVACEDARSIWRELIRVAIAVRLWPSSTRKRMAYSSICTLLRELGRATRHISDIDRPGFWSRVTREQMVVWLGKRGLYYGNLLRRLNRNGAIQDAPVARPRPKEGLIKAL